MAGIPPPGVVELRSSSRRARRARRAATAIGGSVTVRRLRAVFSSTSCRPPVAAASPSNGQTVTGLINWCASGIGR